MGKETPAYGSIDTHRDQTSISPVAKDEASELGTPEKVRSSAAQLVSVIESR